MRFSIGDFLNLSALLLGLPYFFGFIYLNAYYRYFGIDLSELGFSAQYIYVSSFFAIWKFILGPDLEVAWDWIRSPDGLSLLVSSAIIAFVALLIIRKTPPRPGSLSWPYPSHESPNEVSGTARVAMTVTAAALAYFAALTALYFVAVLAANRTAERDLSQLPFAYLIELDADTAADDITNQEGASQLLRWRDGYRVLHANDSEYFLLRNATEDTQRWLIRLPKDDHRSLFMLRDLPE